jgi:hypothetical protein
MLWQSAEVRAWKGVPMGIAPLSRRMIVEIADA